MDPSPVTAPAARAAVFGLRKSWLDPGPGIAMVQIHYAWSPRGTPPDWSAGDEVVLVPQGGALRTAVLEVPRTVGGETDYALHHFFFVVGASDRTASPVITEEIVARAVTYEDTTGAYTSVGVVWSAVEAAPEPGVPTNAQPPRNAQPPTNYTSAAMDGLPFESQGATPDFGSIYEFVRAQPLPHVFRGTVWGVRGTRIRYAYHLIRHGMPDPAQNYESWDDNGGGGWTVDL